MSRHVLLSLALLLPGICLAQDSGPGPVAPATVQVYDVTLIGRSGTLDGTFDFSTTSIGGVTTSGTLAATIGTDSFIGTWQAIDFGGFAFWTAHATSESQALSATGVATPQQISGAASIRSTTGNLIQQLQSLRTFVFFGQAVTAPPTTTAN